MVRIETNLTDQETRALKNQGAGKYRVARSLYLEVDKNLTSGGSVACRLMEEGTTMVSEASLRFHSSKLMKRWKTSDAR